MDGTRSSPFRAGGLGSGLAGPGPFGGRLRSASPSRRALAIDMRRIASLLRDPAGALQCGESMNNSICSSPNSAWEPGDRGAAPVTGVGAGNGNGRAASLSRTVMQNQFTALAERINAGVTMLQRQCETDRRRLAQLEKKFEAKVSDAEKPDGRERWAEVQGSVSGLLEETQALARRLDGLHERLWARTSGSEASKQRNRELEQQVQALEQQNRLAAAAAEELQKRQATKLRRTEHSLEEVLRRVSTLEDEVRQRSAPHRDGGYLEAKYIAMEQNQEALDAELRALQANLEDGLQQLRDEFTNGGQEGTDLHNNDVFEAVRKADVGLSALERKVTGQVEDVSSTVASLRVKVDGVLSRVSGLAERIETAHEPSIDSLRMELSQARNQERRELEAEVQALKHRLQQVQDSNDESCSELREALRQARAETSALSCRPDLQEDNSWMRSTEERLANYEQDLFDLRERLEELTQGDLDGKTVTLKPNEDVEDMRRRLDWLEEQGTSAAEKPEFGRLAQVQNTICDLVEQVSKLKQQASSAEANSSSWQQQVKQIHGLIERKQNEDAASMRVTSEVEAKVGALSSQVADLAARLLEVEGNLDFVRENEPSSLTEAPRMTLSAPLHSEGAPSQPSALQEKLEAIAAHLEIVDDLTDRVGDLEGRWSAGQEVRMGSQSPGPLSDVSFGGEAPIKASAHAETVGRELGDLQLRLDANDGKLKSLQEEVRTKLALAKAEGQGAQTQLNDFAARLGSFEQILSTMQEAPAASFADLDALRLEFADKFDKGPQDETSEVQSRTSKMAEEMMEVKEEVQELSEKVDLTLNDLKEGLVATKNIVEAAMVPIKMELKDLRQRLPDADAEASAEQAILEKLEEVDTKIKGFQTELQASKPAPNDDLAELQSAIKRLQDAAPEAAMATIKQEIKELRKHLPDADAEASAEQAILEKLEEVDTKIKGFQKELQAKAAPNLDVVASSEKMKEMEESIAKLETKLTAIGSKPDAEKADEDQQDLRQTVEDLRKSSEVEVLECKEQLKLLEQKIVEGGPTDAEDLKVRSQVQQQVQDLGLQLSKEVANLAEQQRDILETRTSLQDLTKQFDDNLLKETKKLRNELGALVDQASSTSAAELQSMRQDVTKLVERITSTESVCSDIKKDLEDLLGPRNKIGISTASPESPLDEVRGRLDILSEQVAELQSKQESGFSQPIVTVVNSGHGRHDFPASADGSLNFSLTEQTERPGAPDGSLNFSLTETAKELPTAPERRAPNLYINAEADSNADADILSASDSPASAAGKIAQAGFSSKDAVDDDVPSLPSAPDSPNSEKKDASSSQVSASFNEMSVMADYSVELSTELDEKCDFVEAVRPVRRGMAVSSPIQEGEEEDPEPKVETKVAGVGNDALDTLLKPKERLAPLGAPLAPLGAPLAPLAPLGGDALDSLMGPKATLLPRKLDALDPSAMAKTEVKVEEKEQPKEEQKEESKLEQKEEEEKDDEDYDDNSFDDNMSVPESIQEESDLGSDTRRTEDSV